MHVSFQNVHTHTHMLTWQFCQDSRGWLWGRCDLIWIPNKLKFHLTPQEDHQKLWRLSHSMCFPGSLWQTGAGEMTREKPHAVLWLFREVCLSQNTSNHTHKESETDTCLRFTGSRSACHHSAIALILSYFQNAEYLLVICVMPMWSWATGYSCYSASSHVLK